ncbi:expressed unknown protein [Seminavis robusta]|uniref:Uncharacterized protein n=1 Tax=Seminavis robusta TaxID=568900 RepID=A0A9N8HKA1_9STRA|nr:expressed unknown protein [Seminavis robusta]|eukprot:Sro602_g173730.1 n/a (131) ;mRNA; r:30396-30788
MPQDKDKLLPNPEVPSLFGTPPDSGRNFRAKKDVKGMANRVGKQWEGLGPQKELVPLPESPRTKAKPKIANLPGVHNKNAPTLFGASPQVEKPKPGKLNTTPKKGDGSKAPSLFSGSNAYFSKATSTGAD